MHHDLQYSKLHPYTYLLFYHFYVKQAFYSVSTVLFCSNLRLGTFVVIPILDWMAFICRRLLVVFSPFERFLLLLSHHFIHTWLTFCWMLGRAKTRKLNLLQLVQLMPEDLKRYNGTIHSTFRLYYISNFYVWSRISLWSGIVTLTMLLRCS